MLLFCAIGLMAQEQNYSYLTDKKFRDPTDLIGYNFVPSKMEVPNDYEQELGPGEYSFGISRNNLYVSGQEMTGVYNVNNIAPTEYGYKLSLMNSRDPRMQGHLKVILVNKVYVDALVFKAHKDDTEKIFMLPEMTDNLWESEKAYFTDKYDMVLEDADSIWNKTVTPFLRAQMTGNKVQQRLQTADSTYFNFIEEVKITDKSKPVKEKKEKKKKKDFNIETGEEEMEEEIEETDEGDTDYAEEEMNKKVKIEKFYYIDLKTIFTNEDGSIENSTTRYVVKKWKEREDQSVQSASRDRYQIEFETNKGLINVYLTGKRTISVIEVNGERYTMRGY